VASGRSTRLATRNPWERVAVGQCFFVPALDPDAVIARLLELGYSYGKKPPIVKAGVYRGLIGVLCYRASRA
jgi:hypothetical protein